MNTPSEWKGSRKRQREKLGIIDFFSQQLSLAKLVRSSESEVHIRVEQAVRMSLYQLGPGCKLPHKKIVENLCEDAFFSIVEFFWRSLILAWE